MSIPRNIKEEHILSAMAEIDKSGVAEGRESNRYFLRHLGNDYPPKYIISLANKFVNSTELDADSFNTYEAQDFLRNLKFSVIDIKEARPKKYNGFKLISLDLRNNTLLGTIFYDFVESSDKQTSIYATVIIGPNGTGKSNLFRILIELFRELYQLSNRRDRTYQVDGQFSLKYSFEGAMYDYTNFRNFEKTGHGNFSDKKYYSYLLKDGNRIDYSEAKFPASIVANSIMLTDKYPVLPNEGQERNFPIYNYLGVRNSPQQASTRSYVRKTVEFIVKNMQLNIFREGIKKVASFLTDNSSVEIIFYTLNTRQFFNGSLTPESLHEHFEQIADRYKKSDTAPPFKLNYFRQIMHDRDVIADICDFCNGLYFANKLQDIPRSTKRFIQYDITKDEDHVALKESFKFLDQLRQLGLLSTPEISLGNSSKYNLQESSSGEYHFFSAMSGLMATVTPNGLIFIDEPEISLHPNWQMKYLTFLRQLFSGAEFSSSHILLATHSHFLISDLEGDNSKIIGLKKEKEINGIQVIDFPEGVNTYGWSAEEVLYKVFDVTTTRNFYIAQEISSLLKSLSKKDYNHEELKDKVSLLRELQTSLNDVDPLKTVVNTILKKIE